jgi:MYXO-CTERM domain-containing protein
MRLAVRAGLILLGAGALWMVLSSSAFADVVEPDSAYQPASTGLVADEGQKAPTPKQMPKPDSSDAKMAAKDPEPKASRAVKEEVAADPATPAPEPQVRPAPVEIAPPDPAPRMTVMARAIRPLVVGFQHIGSYLERVVSACQVAVGSGAGGPVLVLGVLSLVTAFVRRRVLGTWSATDEDVPELLFATEVIKPG